MGYGSGMMSGGVQRYKESDEYKRKQSRKKRRRDLIGGIRDEARDFRANLDSYKESQFNSLMPSYRNALEQGTRKTRENYSGRGLLYSGLAQKGEQEVRGGLASQLARSKAGINVEAEKLARTKERAAAESGLENMQMMREQAEQFYNLSMQNQLERRRAMGSFASGVGYAAGAYSGMSGNSVSGGGTDTGLLGSYNYMTPME